jgi:hypothetical protein
VNFLAYTFNNQKKEERVEGEALPNTSFLFEKGGG